MIEFLKQQAKILLLKHELEKRIRNLSEAQQAWARTLQDRLESVPQDRRADILATEISRVQNSHAKITERLEAL